MTAPSPIPDLGELAPGTHIGQFYWDQLDLVETLVPYFAAGLRQHERCIWVCSPPLSAASARAALAEAVPDLAAREQAGEIEILDHEEWYLRRGDLTPEQVIEGWLDAEERALAAGYRGLRVSGNTAWLGADQWRAFADYEARAHAAFRGRKIVALCSYSLTRCGSHEVVDVLHNHGASLVRGATGWELVRGATAALAWLDVARPRGPLAHSVELYRERFPAERVGARLASALERGHGAAALIRGDRQPALRDELARCGIEVDAAIERGQLVLIDSEQVLAEVWTQPGLELDALAARVRDPIVRVIERYGACVAFGDLVDLLAASGDRDASVELERWWNVQLARYPIDLACGYSLASLSDASAVGSFHLICDEHAEVGLDAAPTASDADRLRAELAQVSAALGREIQRRQVVDAAYSSARAAREHLVLLNRLTAALGEVTARAPFVDLVRESVAKVLAAPGIAVVEAGADQQPPLVAVGIGADALVAAARMPIVRATWSSDVAQLPGADPGLRAYLVTPMTIGSRRLATLALGFTDVVPPTPQYRALAEDVARQLALALDRAVSYEHLELERQRAESASRAKDEFLAMLGHELRNPLSPILTATQLMRLRDESVFEKERTVIERQVRHMIRLVDDLLDVSRITRGKVDLRRRPIEIADVIAQAVEIVSPAMEERAHELKVDVATSGMVVHADPNRLAQVIGNLLNNAAKYTPHGGAIRVTARASDNTVVVSVRDTGIGIDPKLLPHVFDLFVQGRQGIDRAAGGLGLGLAIARTLVELHGGTIRARSAGEGQGSEMIVELPRYANTRPSVRASQSGTFVLGDTRPCRVLVVDDNEDAAFLFSEALRKLGHDVVVAHDGPSALEAARVRPPEIAFLDIGLPVMDGYELGRRLKELGGAGPKLVAVTGYGHSSDRVRSREAGFDLHLVKPVDLSAIQEALAKLNAAKSASY